MACSYVFTPRGERDRDHIAEYLLYDLASPNAARRFGDELAAAIGRICAFPRLYAVSRIPRLAGSGYRVCFFDGYALVYRYTGDGAGDATDAGADDGADVDGGLVVIARVLPAGSDYGRIV